VRQIQQVELPGSQSTIVWSHLNKVEPLNFADVSPWAWREADGTVNLFIATFEAYRLCGSNLLSLSSQVGPRIYFRPFVLAPYSDDGVNLYSLVHMEWPAACLIPGDIDLPGAYYNSWVTTITQMKSTDGGASTSTWSMAGGPRSTITGAPGIRSAKG